MKKLHRLLLRSSPERVVAAALLLVAAGLQVYLRALPDWANAGALVLHIFGLMNTYLLVILIAGLWRLAPALMNRTENQSAIVRRAGQEVIQGVCFGIVVTASLYIKLLEPLVRQASYDRIYDSMDRAWFFWMKPLIAWRVRYLHFHWVDTLYFVFFFGMFLVSFSVHAFYGRAGLRRVFLATLLVQGIGGVLYLAAPAVGPFLYHASVNALMGSTENSFLLVRQSELAGGIPWFNSNSGHFIDVGLAAMPSLHAAGSLVFFYYAWRYVKWLGMVYTPVFAWILFGTMATRWHYGIDLVVGVALTCGCIALTNRWMDAHEAAHRTTQPRALLDKEAVAVVK